MTWTPPSVDTDVDAVTARILDALTEKLPGYQPHEGSLDVAIVEEFGRECALLAATAVASIDYAVAGIGETVFGVAARRAVAATMTVELTLSAESTIPAGFTVIGVTPAGAEQPFILTADTRLPIGASSVVVTAAVAGVDANGVPPGPLTIATASATVVAATALGSSRGGVSAESIEVYLDRLVDTLATLRLGGVRAADLAVIARTVAGVGRAVGVDLYDPTNPAVVTERAATVFLVDDLGQPVSPTVKTAVKAALEAVREVNFKASVADPTYTALTVTYTAVAESGAVPASVKTAIDNAIKQWLSPSRWGSTPGDPTAWTNTPVVRFLELARVAGTAPGVAYLSDLKLNDGTADVSLPGKVPLPDATSTVSGTVS